MVLGSEESQDLSAVQEVKTPIDRDLDKGWELLSAGLLEKSDFEFLSNRSKEKKTLLGNDLAEGEKPITALELSAIYLLGKALEWKEKGYGSFYDALEKETREAVARGYLQKVDTVGSITEERSKIYEEYGDSESYDKLLVEETIGMANRAGKAIGEQIVFCGQSINQKGIVELGVRLSSSGELVAAIMLKKLKGSLCLSSAGKLVLPQEIVKDPFNTFSMVEGLAGEIKIASGSPGEPATSSI